MSDMRVTKVRAKINEKKLTKIVWEYPDTLEMKDKDGNTHTYSIIEILDGITAIAKQQKDNK